MFQDISVDRADSGRSLNPVREGGESLPQGRRVRLTSGHIGDLARSREPNAGNA
jgi:hypothetical protein